MKKETIVLLLDWMWSVTSALIYQSNIFPHDHLVDMNEKFMKVIDALENEK